MQTDATSTTDPNYDSDSDSDEDGDEEDEEEEDEGEEEDEDSSTDEGLYAYHEEGVPKQKTAPKQKKQKKKANKKRGKKEKKEEKSPLLENSELLASQLFLWSTFIFSKISKRDCLYPFKEEKVFLVCSSSLFFFLSFSFLFSLQAIERYENALNKWMSELFFKPSHEKSLQHYMFFTKLAEVFFFSSFLSLSLTIFFLFLFYSFSFYYLLPTFLLSVRT